MLSSKVLIVSLRSDRIVAQIKVSGQLDKSRL